MQIPDDNLQSCPKCDNNLETQTDGSTITLDIAHNGETVREALRKMVQALETANRGVAARLRIIVGSGLIQEACLEWLINYQRRGDIRSYEQESHNAGAIVVYLNKSQ
jgi:hypothetical protein